MLGIGRDAFQFRLQHPVRERSRSEGSNQCINDQINVTAVPHFLVTRARLFSPGMPHVALLSSKVVGQVGIRTSVNRMIHDTAVYVRSFIRGKWGVIVMMFAEKHGHVRNFSLPQLSLTPPT